MCRNSACTFNRRLTKLAWLLLLLIPTVGVTQSTARLRELPTSKKQLLRLVKAAPPVSKDIRRVFAIGPFRRYGCFISHGWSNLCTIGFGRDGTGGAHSENSYRVITASISFKWYWWDWPSKKADVVGGTLCLISDASGSDSLTQAQDWWFCDRFWVGQSESDEWPEVYYYTLNFRDRRSWASQLPIGSFEGSAGLDGEESDSASTTEYVRPDTLKLKFDTVSYERCLRERQAYRGGMVNTPTTTLILDKSACEIEATVWEGVE